MSERFVIVHLTNPAHRMPMPNAPRLFSAADAGETVDIWDAFWIGRLKDKSVTLGPRPGQSSRENLAPAMPMPAAVSEEERE
jgi:hypothetical protein